MKYGTLWQRWISSPVSDIQLSLGCTINSTVFAFKPVVIVSINHSLRDSFICPVPGALIGVGIWQTFEIRWFNPNTFQKWSGSQKWLRACLRLHSSFMAEPGQYLMSTGSFGSYLYINMSLSPSLFVLSTDVTGWAILKTENLRFMRVDGKTSDRVILSESFCNRFSTFQVSAQSMMEMDGLLESASRWSSSPGEFPY